jgi:hypothetical protein
MRNSTDQDDEQTTGVTKRSLLSGERAMPVPEPGALKSEQEQPKPEQRPMPRRQRAAVSAPSAPVQSAPATPPAPRATVEMIEAGKKRSVDFP